MISLSSLIPPQDEVTTADSEARTPPHRRWPGRVIPPARLALVARELASGTKPTVIAEKLSAQWGITTRQVRNYIRRVHEMWGQDLHADHMLSRRIVTDDLFKLLAAAKHDGDWRAAVRIYRVLAQIEGLL